MVCYFSDCFNWAQNQHFIQKHEILTASVGRVDHETRPFRLMAHKKTNPKRSSRIRKCLLFVCSRNKKKQYLGFDDAKQKCKKKVLVARQQQLAGSEAGGQLGRFHFTWDGRWWWCTPAGVWHRIPLLRRRCIYFSLSLSLLSPRLKHLKPKGFFPTILHLTTTGFFFRFLGQHLSLSLESQPKSTSSSSSLASDLYPMSRNKTLHSSSCTLLSVSYLHLFSHLHGSH